MSGTKKITRNILSLVFTVTFIFLMTAAIAPGVMGATAVDLGSAGNFVILAESAIGDTPTSIITGDVGLSPTTGAAITGLTCSEITGTIYTVDATGPACRVVDPILLTTAITDMHTAYNTAYNLTNPGYTDVGSSGDIGGLTLLPGLYKFTTAVTITNDVTISGSSSDVWIFQIPGTSALGISNGKNVILNGGAQAQNIFWVVGGATTIGTGSGFNGTILDKTAITMGSGATLNGRAFAQSAVTLSGNTVTFPTAAPPAPVASFTGTPAIGGFPLTVVFTDSSTGSPTSWNWNFGDSDTTNYTVQNPVHTYASVGTYTVALTATNAGGSSTDTQTNYISVVPAPTTSFTGTPTTGTVPLTVVFTDSSTGSPTSWNWDFGDSDTTNYTDQNPVHTYASTGTYTVVLTATNVGGFNSATRTDYLSVLIPAPVASFTGAPITGTVPLTVVFTDSSTGFPTSWHWNFGDDNNANYTVQNPMHTYASTGTYTVNLTATNAGGSNTVTQTNYITVEAIEIILTVTGTNAFGDMAVGDNINATPDLVNAHVTSNTHWAVTVSDAEGRATPAGYMAEWDGLAYVGALGEVMTNPLSMGTDGFTYYPLSADPSVALWTGNAVVSQDNYPWFKQVTVTGDKRVAGNHNYRIVVTFTASAN